MATLIDSYSESNQHSNVFFHNAAAGQSFTNANEITLMSCKFYIKKRGSPTGNIVAKLYAHEGSYGNGGKPPEDASPLATSSPIDISGLTTSYQLIEFTFADRYVMSASTYYVIVLEYNDGVYETDDLWIGYDFLSISHSGNYCIDIPLGGIWGSTPYSDMCFYVYGEIIIVCETGSYSLTGQDTTLKASYNIVCAVGNYALTGFDAIISKTYLVVCETGSYILTGTDTTLKATYKLVCAVGNYTLTGIDVAISKAYQIICETGNYALTGIDTNLKVAYKIVCASGSYALTGIAVVFTKTIPIICECGKYILTGIDIRIRKAMTNLAKVSTSWTNKEKKNTTFINKPKG